MPAQGFNMFGPIKVTKITQMIRDRRDQVRPPLPFTARVPRVPAMRGELMGRFLGNVYIADLIALDAPAPTYKSGEFKFETTKTPKVKIGRSLTETQMEQYFELTDGMPPSDEDVMMFFGPTVQAALLGIEHRIEAMVIAMMLDEFNYDRLGYKAAGVTWGMQSDLKFTASVPWNDAANATPVDDLLGAKLYASQRYGRDYNRATMSTQAFRYMIATAEFQAKAKLYLPTDITFSNLSLNRLTEMHTMAERVTGLTIVMVDHRYHYQDPNGVDGSARFFPLNKVVLDNSANDGDSMTWDLASTTLIESLFLGLPNTSVVGGGNGSFGSRPQRGPLSYLTYPTEINPPALTFWAADAVWPRKHDLQANAIVTIGDFADTIPVANPTF
jgi:hypothetical protein